MNAALTLLTPCWSWWKVNAEPIYYLVAALAAMGAFWVYRGNSRLERSRWAASLYEKFYERDHLKRMREY